MVFSLGRVRRVGRWVRNRFVKRGLILLYHRVSRLPVDPQALAVSPELFDRHMDELQRSWRPVSLVQMCEGLRDGSLPERAVAVTFDDGYEDNLTDAKPVLERYGIPATVFIATGYTGAGREFFWDELERLLLHTRPVPGRLRLSVGEWSVDEMAGHLSWNVMMDAPTGTRQRLYRELCERVRLLPETEQMSILAELRAWVGAPAQVRPTHRTLAAPQILLLAQGGLVEVGAHTVSHPVLATLSPAGQQAEIRQSKERLEALLGRPVSLFSYPYGSTTDFTPETAALVRESGFSHACANYPDTVWRGSDNYALPRFLVRNWSGPEFARRLEGWYRG